MKTDGCNVPLMTETAKALSDWIDQGAKIGFEVMEALRPGPGSELGRAFQSITGRWPMGTGCGCQIPPPCWAPRPAGEVVSHVCPGATATLLLRITNCGPQPRAIKIEAAGKTPGVSVSPPGLNLGPMERGVVVATASAPASASAGSEREIMLWVRGCHDHYVRWTVRVASRGAHCCHEVEVEDCPDLVHHWYDHFYCMRPCYDGVHKEG